MICGRGKAMRLERIDRAHVSVGINRVRPDEHLLAAPVDEPIGERSGHAFRVQPPGKIVADFVEPQSFTAYVGDVSDRPETVCPRNERPNAGLRFAADARRADDKVREDMTAGSRVAWLMPRVRILRQRGSARRGENKQERELAYGSHGNSSYGAARVAVARPEGRHPKRRANVDPIDAERISRGARARINVTASAALPLQSRQWPLRTPASNPAICDRISN